jgi:asparagine N-glycosylation enzyme membrane subunit Stt3
VRSSGAHLALFLAVTAVAVALRTVPAWPHVFPRPGEVRLLGADPYYHLRHMRYALAHFPALKRWDHATHYPKGQRAENAGLFTLAVAAGALPWPGALERVAALAPVALCAAGFAALYALGAALGGSLTGLLACVILLVYPAGYLTRSLVGFADHHAAEVVLALLTVLGAVRCLAGRRPWWQPALLHALPLALFQFTWVGGPIYLVVLAAAFLIVALARLGTGADLDRLPVAVARYGLGLLATVVPLAMLAPDLIMAPARFPLFVGAVVALVAGAAPALAGVDAAARRWARPRLAAVALLAGAALAIAGLTRLPPAPRLLHELLSPKTTAVAEHQEVTLTLLTAGHGVLVWVALLGLVLAIARVRAPDGPGRLLASAAGVLVLALWVLTRDYAYAAAPFVALLSALVLVEALAAAASGAARRLGAVVVAVVVVAPLWPLRWAQPPWPGPDTLERLTILDDGWLEAMRWMAEHTPAPTLPVDARVPAWRHGDFAYPPGTYGVWAPWDYGNLVAAVGRRPVVWSQGASVAVSAWLLETDERASLARLDRGCRDREHVRYVVLDAKTLGDHFLAQARLAGQPPRAFRNPIGRIRVDGEVVTLFSYGPQYSETVAARLYYEDGGGFGHYRLVYASPQQSFSSYVAHLAPDGTPHPTRMRRRAVALRTPDQRGRYEQLLRHRGIVAIPGEGYVYDAIVTSSVKIFERVAGARLTGRAPADSTVDARLTLRSLADGRVFEYRHATTATAEGEYRLALPHATAAGPRRAPAAVEALGAYRVRALSDGGAPVAEASVDVAEEDVQDGGTATLDLLPGGE